MKYKTWRKVEIILLFIDILTGFIAWLGNGWAGILFMIFTGALIILDLLFNRCPHCGRHLGRSKGPCCNYCGKNMEEGE